MEINAVSAKNLAAVAESLNDVSAVADPAPAAILGGSGVNVVSSSPDLDAILSLMRMETNEARLDAARRRISSAFSQLSGLSEEQMAKVDEMKASGGELIDAEKTYDAYSADYSSSLAKLEKAKTALDKANEALEKALSDAQKGLEGAEDSLLSAKEDVASAQVEYDSAEAAFEVAKEKYEKSRAALNEMQGKFDSLVSSLDAESLTALRDALKLFADDVDHLHDEIEEDDKKHNLAAVRSVENVISDSLKRLDEEFVDELQDRHLDHV